jgi:syntaxin 8
MSTSHRYALLGGDNGLSSAAPAPEAEDWDSYTVPQLRAQQTAAIEEQDRGLEALSQVISRQKLIATVIGDEVDYQNDLIEDITDHVDRTRDRLVGETGRVRTIEAKDNTCGYWIVIVLLLLAIVIVAAI